MAELVNLQQTEYDEVLGELITLHQDELESIKSVSQEIRLLCEREGGFYVEFISEKINMLLDQVEVYILAGLTDHFEASRTAMETFMVSIKSLDAG